MWYTSPCIDLNYTSHIDVLVVTLNCHTWVSHSNFHTPPSIPMMRFHAGHVKFNPHKISNSESMSDALFVFIEN